MAGRHAAVRGSLRSSVVSHGGGLLLVGTRSTSRGIWRPIWWTRPHGRGQPELAPTLVRHGACPSDPAHLAVGLGRLEAAGRGETLLVVAPGGPDAALLERVHDARRAGATVLALDGGDAQMRALAHDALTVRAPDTGLGTEPDTERGTRRCSVPGGGDVPGDGVDLDTVQHLVSAAAGENSLPGAARTRRFRDRLYRPADH